MDHAYSGIGLSSDPAKDITGPEGQSLAGVTADVRTLAAALEDRMRMVNQEIGFADSREQGVAAPRGR